MVKWWFEWGGGAWCAHRKGQRSCGEAGKPPNPAPPERMLRSYNVIEQIIPFGQPRRWDLLGNF